MSTPIISVSHVSKKYSIGEKQLYYSFRDSLTNIFSKSVKRISGYKETLKNNEFWALKDISFDVKPGEVIGIIGKNGAGKSTFLKILSQITPPTLGEIRLKGRVASLLEVGTGFHPELTGRENIFLNGAILGMKRSEIREKFSAIVEFAETQQFLDTPVKHYSSGMYMRLAFAVAANLESDILLIDEVLAVGDAQFQKKCLGKMNEISRSQGRTILFVSHNIGAINSLCQKGILLDKGKITSQGDISTVVNRYLNSGSSGITTKKIWQSPKTAPGDDHIKLHSVKVTDINGKLLDNVNIGDPFNIEVEYWNLKAGKQRVVGLHFISEQGITLFVSYDLHNQQWREQTLPKGLIKSICTIPGNLLAEGRIFVNVAVNINYMIRVGHAFERDAVSFNVVDDYSGNTTRGDVTTPWDGVVRPKLNWHNQIIKKI